jgi:hypothetical protein
LRFHSRNFYIHFCSHPEKPRPFPERKIQKKGKQYNTSRTASGQIHAALFRNPYSLVPSCLSPGSAVENQKGAFSGGSVGIPFRA